MNWKSIGLGVVLTIICLTIFGGVYAAIANAGQQVTVPQGKTMVYFTMNTADAAYLRDSLCHNYNYQENLTDEQGNVIPNPVTCQQFGQQKFIQYAKENMAAYHKWQYENGYTTTDWQVTG